MATTNLQRTALYERHVALGARMVPFGGFEMPVQYGGVLREHDAVRQRAGLFDLSHMGQIALRGGGVGAWGDSLTVNHVETLAPGGARYNLFCNERGGTHDDVIFYRESDGEWLLVVNAGNARKMWALLSEHAHSGVTMENRHGAAGLIAIQGPRSAEILASLLDGADRERVIAMRYYACARANVMGKNVLIARTGYTGEDGFEIYVPSDVATSERVWNQVMEAGRAFDIRPCGLGARNTLRLESKMALYGHEISDKINVWEAGLDRYCKMEKGDFIGRAALERAKAAGLTRTLVGIEMIDRGIARDEYCCCNEAGERIGVVTSGSPSPTLGKNIALAYVPPAFSAVGTILYVEIRGQKCKAQVVATPFYKRQKKAATPQTA